jgi:hypothetical protein
MKYILSAALCFCLQFTFGQKLDIISLEKILNASFSSADSLLKKSKFAMAEKRSADNYFNYYYTSYEKVDSAQLIRSLTIMDVFEASDTSRFILYRTYTKKDQDELELQLTTAGYVLTKRTGNDFTYKKGDQTITNRILEKNLGSTRKVKVYEFELGR